jgi:hypothetical protein
MSSTESYKIIFSTHNGHRGLRAGNITGHTGLFFGEVAYSKYDKHSEMVYRDRSFFYKVYSLPFIKRTA